MRAENEALRAQIEDLHGDTSDDMFLTAIQQDLDRLENLPRLLCPELPRRRGASIRALHAHFDLEAKGFLAFDEAADLYRQPPQPTPSGP